MNPSSFSVRAPGRVNLIGEHVDYNGGFVLPMAIPLETHFEVEPRPDRTVELYSENFGQQLTFSLDAIQKQNNWIDYVQGVAQQLAAASIPLHGFRGMIRSNVPVASGLSSSASMEVGSALIFTHLAQQPMAPSDLALVCQAAENKFVGVNSGIMDQMAVAGCRADHALLIDCRSLEHEQVPLVLEDHAIIVTDSGAPRELAGSAYNERRAQCEEGLRLLQARLPHAASLRDVTPEELESHAGLLPEMVLRRCRHVVREIERTLVAVDYLRRNDLADFGHCMVQSHRSLAELYEVTSRELDWLVDWSLARPGVLGSRMTGAGFGGCTVTLIEKQASEAFTAELPIAYTAATGRTARCWACTAVDGAAVKT